MNKYKLTVNVENSSYILTRILQMFSRRRKDLEEISMKIEKEASSQTISLVVFSSEQEVEKLSKQIEKQMEVIQVKLERVKRKTDKMTFQFS